MFKILNEKSVKKVVKNGGVNVHDDQRTAKGGFVVDCTNSFRGLALNVHKSNRLVFRVIIYIVFVLQLYNVGGILGGRSSDDRPKSSLTIENIREFSPFGAVVGEWTGVDVTGFLAVFAKKVENATQLFMVLAKTAKMGSKNG